MSTQDWRQQWQQAKSDPYTHAAAALIWLNGLSAAEVAHLDTAVIDHESGWIRTSRGNTYPLVRQSADALHNLAQDTAAFQAAARALAPTEADAHRRLSGAVWISDPELRLALETTGSREAPILPLNFTFPYSVADRLQVGEVSDVAREAVRTAQAAADWLMAQDLEPKGSLLGRALGLLRRGSLVFLIASTGVSGLNMVHNVLMGRLLSPADYSQLTLLITLQLLIGLLPSAVQTVTARFAARYQAQESPALMHTLYERGARLGWLMGLGGAALLLALSPVMIDLFQLDGFGLVLPVLLAVPFFVRMGADRGLLQGLGAYHWLSGAYLVEGLLRLVVGVLLGYALLSAGRALDGAVWAVAQSMLGTWFIGWLALRHLRTEEVAPDDNAPHSDQADWLRLGGMTALVLIGQALITNSDFLLVKNFFSPDDAGLYAAVSVLGRIVYFGALPLTVLLVPLVARRQALDEPTRPILLLLIGGGAAVCGGLILGALLFAPQVLGLLYGEGYIAAAGLLAPYALAASLYTLTNLVITYQIALGGGSEAGLPIVAGIAQIVGVLLFHETLSQVIAVQVVLMGLLLAAVLWRALRTPLSPALEPVPEPAV